VRLKDAVGVGGRYALWLAEQRPKTIRDRLRVASERDLARGDARLLRSDTRSAVGALADYRKAALNSRLAGYGSGQAVALLAIADTLRSLGRLTSARLYYERASALAAGDTRILSDAALGLSTVCLFQGDTQKALSLGMNALRLSRDSGDSAGEDRALVEVGDVYNDMGDREKPLAWYKEALTASRKADDLGGQSLALLNLGYVSTNLGDKEGAREYLNEGLSTCRRLGDSSGEAKSLAALGHISSAVGENQQALAFYGQAISALRGAVEPFTEAPIYAGMGNVYYRLGDRELALGNYRKAMALWKRTGYRKGEAGALAQLVRIYGEMASLRLALERILEARRTSQEIGDLCLQGFIDVHLGQINLDLTQYRDAQAAFEGALREAEACGPWTKAQALAGIGDIRYLGGDQIGAVRYYQDALDADRVLKDVFAEVSALCKIAKAERDAGDLSSARGRIEEALRKIESLRENVASESLRASYFATVREAFELCIDVQIQHSKTLRNEQELASAFQVSERARARSLLDALAGARVDVHEGADAVLLQRERGLREKISEQEQILARIYAERASSGAAAQAEQDLKVLLNSLDAVEAEIRAASPPYAALMHPPLLTLAETQQLLGKGDLLLEYAVGEKRSYLWAVASSEVHCYELPGRGTIDAAARKFYAIQKPATPIAQSEAEASELGSLLLGPVAGQLSKRRLVIVPDGALHYIPFGALSVPASDTKRGATAAEYRPLVLDHEIVYLPSASTLALLRRGSGQRERPAKTLAIFADPVFSRAELRSEYSGHTARIDREGMRALRAALKKGSVTEGSLPRLPSSRVEAQAIRDEAAGMDAFLALGLDASLATLKSADLSQYRFIHFATHGLIDSENPELSSLVLSLVDSKGERQNGFLRLHDIYNMKLRADLVVLSACETALGKEIRGEGLVSLTRGFMHAGAVRVMASLWKIDDEATAELMKRFYGKILRGQEHPAAALREAQLEMWQQRRWRSPFYWAGFVLQGELE
jgi:CHAT domain-containing protein